MFSDLSSVLIVLWTLTLIALMSSYGLLNFSRRDLKRFNFYMNRELTNRPVVDETYQRSLGLLKRVRTTCLEYEIEFYSNARQISFVLFLCDTTAIVLPNHDDLHLLALVTTHFIAPIASFYGYRYMTKHIRLTIDDYNHQVKEENLYGFAITNRPA